MSDSRKKPNVVFVFSDQHRYQATGFAGDPNVKTPVMDELSKQSINFITAISGFPVCSPYRASLMTGQYATNHGVFLNDVSLIDNIGNTTTIANAFKNSGYNTAYIGKWHLNGNGRSNYIPPERRLGFDYWEVLECTHDYNESYYFGDKEIKLKWEGYDAHSQTRSARQYILNRDKTRPFLMMLSWGPPHNPYETAPDNFKAMYDSDSIVLRPNVPDENKRDSQKDLAGYYAHISALDNCLGELLETIKDEDLENDTIFIYTSDHGDMLGSQGQSRKQRPWDESIRVPFLMRYPQQWENDEIKISNPINSIDIMPTLLGLCNIEIPDTVDGRNLAPDLISLRDLPADGVLIECLSPFGEFTRDNGGREYRGIRTNRYTYVIDKNGPWLLYDNLEDPYQMNNLCDKETYASLQNNLNHQLMQLLNQRNDEFLDGMSYVRQWGYVVDKSGTVRYLD